MHLENVLSLFDGISCGQVALERAGHTVGTYIASEIDKHAITVARRNHPHIKSVGDIQKIKITGTRHYGLLMGGSPCQGFSIAGDQLNFSDPRSRLVLEYIRIKNQLEEKGKLDYFLLENVPMKLAFEKAITKLIGADPMELNSTLVSAQNRRRLYWTNIKGITPPEDREIFLPSILETDGIGAVKDHEVLKVRLLKAMCIDANYAKGADNRGQRTVIVGNGRLHGFHEGNDRLRGFRNDKKKSTLSEHLYMSVDSKKSYTLTTQNIAKIYSRTPDGYLYRKLTPIECERLQTLPDNYTAGISNTQRYKSIGNGWTVDMITHILSFMK